MKVNQVVKENLGKLLNVHHVREDGSIIMSRTYFEFVCEMIALDANMQGFKEAIDGRF